MRRPAEHVGGGFADQRHVGGAGPDIRSGGVRPAERVDDVCHVAQHLATSAGIECRPLRQGHDGLPSAAGQPATANLEVMAADRRRASVRPSRQSG
ncbi:hypothetical protein M271_06670 [Streptomyces rapamycinicus NRRL 5491]|nr:hypothetical protein M271_06670 [Streptomyces rapamycinicus NRRL 5491]